MGVGSPISLLASDISSGNPNMDLVFDDESTVLFDWDITGTPLKCVTISKPDEMILVTSSSVFGGSSTYKHNSSKEMWALGLETIISARSLHLIRS